MSDARDRARGQTSRSRTQRAQRTISKGKQRTSNKQNIDRNIKDKQRKTAKHAYSPSNVPSWRSAESKKVIPGISNLPKRPNAPTFYDRGEGLNFDKEIDEANEGYYLDNRGADAGNPFVTYEQQQEARQKAAYEASLKEQERMRQAIDMAYDTGNARPKDQEAYDAETLELLRSKGTEYEVPDIKIGRKSTIDQSPSTFHTLTNKQKQELIDSDFAAAESEGTLGGTFGAELAENRRKKELGLDYDKSAIYSWDDVESDPYLYQAHQDLGSKNLTPNKYTGYMDRIGAFGHRAPVKSSGGFGPHYGGYGGGGGGGGGGGYGGSGDYGSGSQVYQRGFPDSGTLQERVNQSYLSGNPHLSGGRKFARGGIVSLLRL